MSEAALAIALGIVAFFVLVIIKGGTDPETPRPRRPSSPPITLFETPKPPREDDDAN